MNQKKIERRHQHYGLIKIQSALYAGELENNERKMLVENIDEIIKDSDSVFDNANL